MRYLLSRLPFTFLILGGWLAYEGYQTTQGKYGPVNPVRVGAFFTAAGLSISLAILAFRERYRPRDGD